MVFDRIQFRFSCWWTSSTVNILMFVQFDFMFSSPKHICFNVQCVWCLVSKCDSRDHRLIKSHRKYWSISNLSACLCFWARKGTFLSTLWATFKIEILQRKKIFSAVCGKPWQISFELTCLNTKKFAFLSVITILFLYSYAHSASF